MRPTIRCSSWSWHLRNGTYFVVYFLILRYDRLLWSYGEVSVNLNVFELDFVGGVSRIVYFFESSSKDCSFSSGEISLLYKGLPT